MRNAKDGKTSADLIGSVETNVLDLSTESKAIKEPIDLAEGLSELIEERKVNEVKQMGISTGFPILDFQIDGLVPGTLNIISARLKVGKSAILSNIATHVAYMQRIPVLYIDTEMPFGQWRDRIIASMSGVRERDIKHGGYDPEIYDKIVNKCVKIVNNGKLFHEFMPGYNVEKIVALYKKYKLKHNIGLMIFDYIKEPDSSSLDRQRKEYQVLGDVTTKLKDLAGELDIPALAAVQINRANEIADSDRIARYADVICQWMVKTEEEIENGGDPGGTHKLVVRETRRGGSTPVQGIGFKFFKEQLCIKEVNAPDQLIKYGEKVINSGSASDELE
jgi:replicative DNA helicase